MRWKAIALTGMISVAQANAQGLGNQSADFTRFIERHLCTVTAFLTLLSRSEEDKNQYVILSPRKNASDYVQCLFRLDEPIFCEAASYYFRNKRESPKLYRISDEKRKVLEQDKFTFRPRGNFYIEIPRPEDDNCEPLARFMLTTLYKVYDVRFIDSLKIQGPKTLEALVALRGCDDPVISTLQLSTPISPGARK